MAMSLCVITINIIIIINITIIIPWHVTALCCLPGKRGPEFPMDISGVTLEVYPKHQYYHYNRLRHLLCHMCHPSRLYKKQKNKNKLLATGVLCFPGIK